MVTKIRISIIIPTFNSAKVLRRAVDSIVNQTFTDWEVLIMDGVSTDDTLKIAQSYNDSRIRIYSEPDKGIYDAMNKGIKKAKGEWLYFLGSDDWLITPETLRSVFSMDIDSYDVVYGDVESVQLVPEHSGEWSLSTIEYNRCHQCIFYRKQVFRKLGLYNLDYPVLADFDLNLKWFFSKRIKNKYIPITVAHYSEGGFSYDQSDIAFNKNLSYLELIRGRHRFSHRDKINLINDTLHSGEKGFFIRVFLQIWKLKLKTIIFTKDKLFHK